MTFDVGDAGFNAATVLRRIRANDFDIEVPS
jgi:hypothetical protein